MAAKIKADAGARHLNRRVAAARSTSASRLSSNGSVGDGDRRRERSDSDILVSEYHKVCRLVRSWFWGVYFVLLSAGGMAPQRMFHARGEHIACVSCGLPHVGRALAPFPSGSASHAFVFSPPGPPACAGASRGMGAAARRGVRFACIRRRTICLRRRRTIRRRPAALA